MDGQAIRGCQEKRPVDVLFTALIKYFKSPVLQSWLVPTNLNLKQILLFLLPNAL